MFDLLVIRSTEDQSNNAIKDFIALITLTIFYKHLLQITKFIWWFFEFLHIFSVCFTKLHY
jgi:hypothetical protein